MKGRGPGRARYVKLTPKETLFVLLAAALLAVYAVFFTDWFKARTIHISHTVRVTPQAARFARATGTLIGFGLGQPLKLTEIKVVSLAEWQTNNRAVALWHLVSDSNSVPVRSFYYGQNLRGMHPYIGGEHPHPLATNQTYRLFVAAGKIKGQHDFQLGVVAPPAAK